MLSYNHTQIGTGGDKIANYTKLYSFIVLTISYLQKTLQVT